MTRLCSSCLLLIITPAVGAIPFARFWKDVHACNSDLMVQSMASCRSAHLLAPRGSVNSFTSAGDRARNSLEISSYSASATSSDADDNSDLRYDFKNVRASLAIARMRKPIRRLRFFACSSRRSTDANCLRDSRSRRVSRLDSSLTCCLCLLRSSRVDAITEWRFELLSRNA